MEFNIDFIDSRLFYKLNCWSHENEYRIILTDIKAIEEGLEAESEYLKEDKKLIYENILGCFEEIIFGNLVELEEIKSIIKLLESSDYERIHLKLRLAKNPYRTNNDKIQSEKEKLIKTYNDNVRPRKIYNRYMDFYLAYDRKLE